MFRVSVCNMFFASTSFAFTSSRTFNGPGPNETQRIALEVSDPRIFLFRIDAAPRKTGGATRLAPPKNYLVTKKRFKEVSNFLGDSPIPLNSS